MTNRQAAINIIKQLRKTGHTALLAGGCVRDMLLSRPAKDYDVATSAHPDEICRHFKRHLKIGAKFGVVMVLLDNQQVEVATFRTEKGYADGRHPDHVEFADARQDAQRRDFTVNGMFYDPIEKKVIDFVGGRADLKKTIIRTIGTPDERFGEDYLRLLRAVRFATQLNFTIEQNTLAAVAKYAPCIKHISTERIAAELEAVLTDPARQKGTKMLWQTGLLTEIFPTLNDPSRTALGIEVLANLHNSVDFATALAALFTACPDHETIESCNTLKLSKAQMRDLHFLIENIDKLAQKDLPLSDIKILASSAFFDDLYELARATHKANGRSLRPLTQLKKRVEKIEAHKIKPKPLLDGHELIALGALPGPMVGRLSKEMYIAQLEEQITTKDHARQWAEQWLEKNTLED